MRTHCLYSELQHHFPSTCTVILLVVGVDYILTGCSHATSWPKSILLWRKKLYGVSTLWAVWDPDCWSAADIKINCFGLMTDIISDVSLSFNIWSDKIFTSLKAEITKSNHLYPFSNCKSVQQSSALLHSSWINPECTRFGFNFLLHQHDLNLLFRHAQLICLHPHYEVNCVCLKRCSVSDEFSLRGGPAIVVWVIVGRWGSSLHQRLEDGCSEHWIDADKTLKPHWWLIKWEEEQWCHVCKQTSFSGIFQLISSCLNSICVQTEMMDLFQLLLLCIRVKR